MNHPLPPRPPPLSPSPLASLAMILALAACGASTPSPAICATAPAPSPTPSPTSSSNPGGPTPASATVDDARAFVAQVDKDLRRLWTTRAHAGWVNKTYITPDTDLLAATTEEATMEYVTRAVREAKRFEGVPLPNDIARQLLRLRLAQTLPAPGDATERGELAELGSAMPSIYGRAKYCPVESKLPKHVKGKCWTQEDLAKVLASSRDWDVNLEAWRGWHAIGRDIRQKYVRYVELANKGARENGYADLGAQWRSGYDMPPAELEAEIERLWQQVKPLYDDLHCHVRARLRKIYGKERIPEKGAIPASVLGNMWAQQWEHVYDLVEPHKLVKGGGDVTKKLQAKKIDPVQMVKMGERFFTSLGLDPLPKTFWERSMLVRPRDREVQCHAMAGDPSHANDLRIKMCIEPTERDLIVIHHELGHDYYYNQYYKLPMLFQSGANDGFHEGIGDTLALSVTSKYLKDIGLAHEASGDAKEALNHQMKMALEKISFLPFGLIIDKWRWDVFAGKTPKEKYNAAWWSLRRQYEGIDAPVARTEDDFDPGAKYHVPANVPYLRYFLAHIYQFQFHRALCRAAGHTGPLDTCSIYGNKAAGEKLRAMLSLGASKPWPEAMKAISGETKGDATALLEYFAPLREYLKAQNKGEVCGW